MPSHSLTAAASHAKAAWIRTGYLAFWVRGGEEPPGKTLCLPGFHIMFVAERLLPLPDEKRLEMAARSRSIQAKEGEPVGKLLSGFARPKKAPSAS